MIDDFVKLLAFSGLVGGGYLILKGQEKNRDLKKTQVRQPVAENNTGLGAILGLFGALIGENAGSTGGARATPFSGSSSAATGGVKQLLDLIAIPESGGDYNRIYAGISRADYPKKPLTQMTVGEVLDWQDSIDSKYNSEAAGRYQIMEDTLRGLGLPRRMKFDAAGQDKAAMILLERRGLKKYKRGQISAEQFALNLAKEWAGLPVPFKTKGAKKTVMPGESYYAAFNGNRAGISVDSVMSAIANI